MTDTERDPFGPWEPAGVDEVAERFSGVRAPWWIAGGHAVELAVGRPLRPHGDIDVLLPRAHQLAAQRALPGWEWWAADPPGALRPWAPGERLPGRVRDIWCRPGPGEPWRVQVMLDELDGDEWVSARDPRVRLPLTAFGRRSSDGVPYLAPHVQLFHKAADPRPKDETDFTAALPVLTPAERAWLARSLTLAHGHHPWTARLTGRGSPEGSRAGR